MSRPVFPILSLNRLAALVGCKKDKLVEIAESPNAYYRTRFLKRMGKDDRPIDIAIGPLARIHRRVLDRILCDLAPRDCSFGGIKGRSARANAEVHLNARFLAKVDVRRFYPSIHHRWVQYFFEKTHSCSPPVANVLRKLLTLRCGLPQGTCTSPALADRIMGPTDDCILAAVGPQGVKYTRYVDDMTFSASFPLRRLVKNSVLPILHKTGLREKRSKSGHFGPDRDVVVTGYSCRGKVRPPKTYIETVETELRQAHRFCLGRSSSLPPYAKETYWGVIRYVRETDASAARSLRKLFDMVDWSIIDPFELPGKKAQRETPSTLQEDRNGPGQIPTKTS